MDTSKLNRILGAMEEKSVPQMIIADPLTIFWLTGKMIVPGERLLALYLNVNGSGITTYRMVLRFCHSMWRKIKQLASIKSGRRNSCSDYRNWRLAAVL